MLTLKCYQFALMLRSEYLSLSSSHFSLRNNVFKPMIGHSFQKIGNLMKYHVHMHEIFSDLLPLSLHWLESGKNNQLCLSQELSLIQWDGWEYVAHFSTCSHAGWMWGDAWSPRGVGSNLIDNIPKKQNIVLLHFSDRNIPPGAYVFSIDYVPPIVNHI